MKTRLLLLFSMLFFVSLSNAQNVNATSGQTDYYLTKWLNGNTFQIGNSLIYDDGTNVGVGTNNPLVKFQININQFKLAIGSASGSALGYGTSYVGFNAARTPSSNWNISTDYSHNGGGVIWTQIGGEMNFAPIGTEAVATSDQTLSDNDISDRITLQLHPDKNVRINNGIQKIVLGPVTGSSSTGWPYSYIGFNAYRSPNPSGSPYWYIQNDGASNGASGLIHTAGGDMRLFNFPSTGAIDRYLSDQDVIDHTSVFIKSDGNVGIGNNNPSEKLVVKGNAAFGDVAGSGLLGNYGNGKATEIQSNEGTFFTMWSDINGGNSECLSMSLTSQYGWGFRHVNNGSAPAIPFKLYNAGLERQRIDANGNIIFGDVLATGIRGNYGAEQAFEIQSNAGNIFSLWSDINGSNSHSFSFEISEQYGWGLHEGYQGTAQPLPFTITSGGTVRLRINPDGKVGIGTFNSTTWDGDYNLYVKKGIRTEKLKVDVPGSNGWADYVFNKDYHLKDLAEVENYISANKHLPGIPSAEEVKKDGIDVAEMQSILLEKIEELTLYLLQFKAEIDELKCENTSLKEKLSTIK